MLSSAPGDNFSNAAKCYIGLQTCSLTGNNTNHGFVSELYFENRIKGGVTESLKNYTVRCVMNCILQ
jgi:hypothetical protein